MKRRSDRGAKADKKSRRTFLRQLGFLAGVSVVPGSQTGRGMVSKVLRQTGTPDDREICQSKFRVAEHESLAERPIGEVVVAIGISFLGTPYEAHSLETEGEERLVIHLRGLDCVTFVENALALARSIRLGKPSFQEFRDQLRLIRYRSGEIRGYSSRLHYFSDWIADNDRKGIVRDIAREIGGIRYGKKIDYMSTHRGSYRQLSDDSQLEQIRRAESLLNQKDRFFLPKEKLAANPGVLESGDIIGITTSIPGLDIVHTGIVLHANGIVKYLHAPLSAGSVQISERSLGDYLEMHGSQTGIMAARPMEPGTRNNPNTLKEEQ